MVFRRSLVRELTATAIALFLVLLGILFTNLVLRLLARAADVPDFAALEATVADTQAKVRESFIRILGKAP